MGGIGKTMISAGLCRDLDVRRSFDKVLWVNFAKAVTRGGGCGY
jgi:hypothetical protein